MAATGGGFFHSPLGVAAGAPRGTPVFLSLKQDDQSTGIAVGVRHACRLSRKPRHAYFPSLPALQDPALRAAATESLIASLGADGIASVIMDSFDAGWQPAVAENTVAVRRREYIVSLDRPECELLAGCGDMHRRKIRRGDRTGFSLRTHTGDEARRLMETTHSAAQQRARARGETVGDDLPDALDDLSVDLSEPWGAAVLGAWNEDLFLSSVMIGWGGKTAYAIMAGSTEAGYESNAASWLQFRIMTTLAQAGFTAYNLGGAGNVTESCDQRPTGLQRFKLGFGATPVDCVGVRRVLRPLHAKAHELRGLFTTPDQS